MSKLGVVLSFVPVVLGCTSSLAPAADKSVEVSAGYAFVKYLEDDAGSAPVGAYVSIAGTRPVTVELDLGWQRDSEEFFDDSIVLDTFTVTAGPRFRGDGGRSPWFLHLLGGLRYDTIEGESNTSWGGQTGGGVDVPIGEALALRLGADFQIFFESGEEVKTLRLGVGLTF